MDMIKEVRRQFADIPELKAALEVMKKNNADMSNASEEDKVIFNAADGKAEYDKCVDISTKASIREMVMPGLLAILVPVFIGFAFGAEMLGGLLAGVTVTGVLMAIYQSNAGGAWDNAKKMIEEKGGKGTAAHKAAVVGDTVGDPFKDTSGPSLNILIKLISVVALVIATSIAIETVNIEDEITNSSYTLEQVQAETTDMSEEDMLAFQEEIVKSQIYFMRHITHNNSSSLLLDDIILEDLENLIYEAYGVDESKEPMTYDKLSELQRFVLHHNLLELKVQSDQQKAYIEEQYNAFFKIDEPSLEEDQQSDELAPDVNLGAPVAPK